jgi:hypothetical protein
MKETLAVINEMQREGVIGKYAIGGAVGALYYLEPAATVDIDIFVSLKLSGPLLTLSPLYDHLGARGFKAEREYIIIENWPVQFLPPTNPLIEEALDQAIPVKLKEISSRVMTAEHLVAIALQTGRAKDFARIVQFVESGKLDAAKLDAILRRHGLLAKWEDFGERYLKP